jgi:hypothetical protein
LASAQTIAAASTKSWISDWRRDSDRVTVDTTLRWPLGFGFSPRIGHTIEAFCQSQQGFHHTRLPAARGVTALME